MRWFRLNDSFSRDPRLLDAGDQATLLHISGLAYSDEQMTDGRIPTRVLSLLWPWTNPKTGRQSANPRKLAEDLVRVGLWANVDSGYEIIDYTAEQRTADEIRTERAAAAARMRKLRADRRQRSGDVLANSDGTSAEVRQQSREEQSREEKILPPTPRPRGARRRRHDPRSGATGSIPPERRAAYRDFGQSSGTPAETEGAV